MPRKRSCNACFPIRPHFSNPQETKARLSRRLTHDGGTSTSHVASRPASANFPMVHTHILHLEQAGLVTRTFRRLDPERQQAILTGILDEAADKGPAALNIKQVAERARVSVGSLYTYFPNREGMLAFAVEVCVRFVTEQFDQFRPYLMALPLRDALKAYLVGGTEWSRMYAGFLRLFARAAYHGDPELSESLVRPVATLLREMVAQVVAAAAERGVGDHHRRRALSALLPGQRPPGERRLGHAPPAAPDAAGRWRSAGRNQPVADGRSRGASDPGVRGGAGPGIQPGRPPDWHF